MGRASGVRPPERQALHKAPCKEPRGTRPGLAHAGSLLGPRSREEGALPFSIRQECRQHVHAQLGVGSRAGTASQSTRRRRVSSLPSSPHPHSVARVNMQMAAPLEGQLRPNPPPPHRPTQDPLSSLSVTPTPCPRQLIPIASCRLGPLQLLWPPQTGPGGRPSWPASPHNRSRPSRAQTWRPSPTGLPLIPPARAAFKRGLLAFIHFVVCGIVAGSPSEPGDLPGQRCRSHCDLAARVGEPVGGWAGLRLEAERTAAWAGLTEASVPLLAGQAPVQSWRHQVKGSQGAAPPWGRPPSS